jgi:hypothetical protein
MTAADSPSAISVFRMIIIAQHKNDNLLSSEKILTASPFPDTPKTPIFNLTHPIFHLLQHPFTLIFPGSTKKHG